MNMNLSMSHTNIFHAVAVKDRKSGDNFQFLLKHVVE